MIERVLRNGEGLARRKDSARLCGGLLCRRPGGGGGGVEGRGWGEGEGYADVLPGFGFLEGYDSMGLS